MKINTWIKTHCTSLKNKNIVLTGSTSGLGYQTLKVLCELEANIIVGVRNTEKAEEQKQELLKLFPNATITVYKLDLSSVASIKNFAGKIKFLFADGIDVLINNAGVFTKTRKILENGHEQHFFINCIAPLLLTKLLKSHLKEKPSSRVVFLGSISCNFSEIDFNDQDFRNHKNELRPYSNSKRWLTFAVFKLKEEFEKENIEVNLIHPGISSTSLFLNSRFKKLQPVLKLIFTKPKKACLNEIAGIFWNTKNREWIGPNIFDIWGMPKTSKLKIKHFNEEEMSKCYEILMQITDEYAKM